MEGSSYKMLNILRNEIKKLMNTEVREILKSARNSVNLIEGEVPAWEKPGGSPVTQADIQIGELFVRRLKEMLPGSVVINEEDFNESVYEEVQKSKYVWVVDPIDGTRAFRNINNKNYCVGVALLENMNPVLSVVYVPEFEINGETDFFVEAIDSEDGIKINGNKYKVENEVKLEDIKYVRIKKDEKLTNVEKVLTVKCKETELIMAHSGFSSLINYILVITDGLTRVFSERKTNIWDIVQSAYIVEKAGGKVFYEDGVSIFPLDINKCKFEDNKLILPANIAGASCIKEVFECYQKVK